MWSIKTGSGDSIDSLLSFSGAAPSYVVIQWHGEGACRR